jgi:multiple sugar transport system permease protein
VAIYSRKPISASQKSLLSIVVIQLVLAVLSILFLVPFLWMLSTSVKTDAETVSKTIHWIPQHPQFGNYWRAINYGADKLGYIPFLVYARNTILLCFLVVAGNVASNSVVAYSFARLKWPGREVAFALTLATMMIPFPVLMVPLFNLFRVLGWVGTYKPLWVPAFFGTAFNIFLLRQFFRAIPFELSEAAKLDGCSEWQIFKDVILPLAKPALAVVALFSFMGTWNDFLGPLIYLVNQKSFTLALGLQAYQSQAGGTAWGLLMAASALVVAPIIILFFFTQRLFIQGISLSGLKG